MNMAVRTLPKRVYQSLEEAIDRLCEEADERTFARHLLKGRIDLAMFPDELLHLVSISPDVFDPGTMRMELQRTPNLNVTFRTLAAGQANGTLLTSAASSWPNPAVVKDGMIWRVMGGVLTVSAAGIVELRDGAQGQPIWRGGIPAINTATPFTIPLNGARLTAPTVGILSSVAMNVDGTLYVAEEPQAGYIQGQ
jgi:hypothetical protein